MLRNPCCHSWCTYSARGENSPPRSSEDIRGLLPAAAHKTHAAAISHLPPAEGLPRGLLMGPPPAKQACCRKLRFHMYCLNGCLTSVHSRPPLKAPPWRMAREGRKAKVYLGRLGFSTCAAAVVDHDLHMAINGFNWHLLVAVVIIPRSRCQSRHQEGGATHY